MNGFFEGLRIIQPEEVGAPLGGRIHHVGGGEIRQHDSATAEAWIGEFGTALVPVSVDGVIVTGTPTSGARYFVMWRADFMRALSVAQARMEAKDEPARTGSYPDLLRRKYRRLLASQEATR